MTPPDSTFIYDGTQGDRDLYHLVDKGSNVIAWAVAIGDDPRNVIEGTLRNLGYIGQVKNVANPVYMDANRTTYQLLDDAGNLIRWQAETGKPYQDVIPGTLENLGTATNSASEYATAPATTTPVNPAIYNQNPIPTSQAEIAAASVGQLPRPADAGTYNLPTSTSSVGTVVTRDTPDPRIKYAGSQGDRDFYTLTDEGGNLISWQTAIGDDPRNVIPGTLINRGASIGDPAGTLPAVIPPVAVVPMTPTPPAPPLDRGPLMGGVTYTPADQRQVASSRHEYLGSFGGRDLYQLADESGNVLRWFVNMGDDSRNVIPGSLENKGTPNDPQPGLFDYPLPKGTAAASSTASTTNSQATKSQPTTTGISPTAGGNNATNGVPGSVLTANNTVSTGGPATATPSARKVGTSGGRDTYQLIDEGGSLIQWQVKAGSAYQEAIPGTLQNLGTPSPATKTAISTTSASNPTSATPISGQTAGGSQSTLVVLAGLAAAVLNVIK